MALLKQVSDRGATLAWSPLKHLPYAFASGTKVRRALVLGEKHRAPCACSVRFHHRRAGAAASVTTVANFASTSLTCRSRRQIAGRLRGEGSQ